MYVHVHVHVHVHANQLGEEGDWNHHLYTCTLLRVYTSKCTVFNTRIMYGIEGMCAYAYMYMKYGSHRL